MKTKLIIAASTIAILALAAWLILRTTDRTTTRLVTTPVTRTTLTATVTATGTVEPVTEVNVGTQVSGIIDHLYVDYNDYVKAGQLIAEMDKVNLEAELASAQAQLASARSEYEYQHKNYLRSKSLYDQQLISDSEYDIDLYNYEKSRAAYDQAQASIVKVRRNLEYATITSPIDGVVIDRAVEEGQTVAAGFETPTLFTIAADLTKMQVIADVDEADIGSVAPGQPVTFTVDAYPDHTFHGTVSQVRLGTGSTTTTTTTSTVVTYEVVITADNPDLKLKPRLTANVSIITYSAPDVLTIPTRALRFTPDPSTLSAAGITLSATIPSPTPDRTILYVATDRTITPRLVTTGHTVGSQVEILDGIHEGETIALDLRSDAPAPTATTERSPFMPGPPGK